MSIKNNDFESSLKELEEIVKKLEGGGCSLDESISLFEKGVELSNACAKQLESAKQKIITLTDAEKRGEQND